MVNATSTANESALSTVLLDLSIPSDDRGGVILAGGIVAVAVVLIVLFSFRARRPPARSQDDAGVVRVEAPREPALEDPQQ